MGARERDEDVILEVEGRQISNDGTFYVSFQANKSLIVSR